MTRVVTLGEIMLRLKSPQFERLFQVFQFQTTRRRPLVPADDIGIQHIQIEMDIEKIHPPA